MNKRSYNKYPFHQKQCNNLLKWMTWHWSNAMSYNVERKCRANPECDHEREASSSASCMHRWIHESKHPIEWLCQCRACTYSGTVILILHFTHALHLRLSPPLGSSRHGEAFAMRCCGVWEVKP